MNNYLKWIDELSIRYEELESDKGVFHKELSKKKVFFGKRESEKKKLFLQKMEILEKEEKEITHLFRLLSFIETQRFKIEGQLNSLNIDSLDPLFVEYTTIYSRFLVFEDESVDKASYPTEIVRIFEELSSYLSKYSTVLGLAKQKNQKGRN